VNLNYPEWDTFAPFGGYKQSGNGREYADWAIHDFLEVKGIIGYGAEWAANSGSQGSTRGSPLRRGSSRICVRPRLDQEMRGDRDRRSPDRLFSLDRRRARCEI
jgi:hypothetical protein